MGRSPRDLAYYKGLLDQVQEPMVMTNWIAIMELADQKTPDCTKALFDLWWGCVQIEQSHVREASEIVVPRYADTSRELLYNARLIQQDGSIHQVVRVIALLAIRIDSVSLTGMQISIIYPGERSEPFPVIR